MYKNFKNFKYNYPKKPLSLTVLDSFNSMGTAFYRDDLVKNVEEITGEKYKDSTIINKLMYLRKIAKIDYCIIDKYRGVYRKNKMQIFTQNY